MQRKKNMIVKATISIQEVKASMIDSEEDLFIRLL